jgi:diacylglycerol O-acyltransferase / wax synthase
LDLEIESMSDPLSPIETVMWRVGQDPTLRMTVGDLILLDRAPSRSSLVERFGDAARTATRLRQRPGDPSYVRRRPHWIVDPEFDPARHIRIMSVAPPGDLRQLLEVVSLLEPVPFDPDRSPWDVTLIEGLAGDKAALFLRAHHVLTDGFGGASMIALLYDDPSPRLDRAGAESTDSVDEGEPESDGRRPGTITIDINKAMGPITSGVSATFNVEPTGMVVRGVQRGLDVANSVSRQVLVAGGPLGDWPEASSMTSRFEVLSIPGARTAALALGGSRNTLLVAAASTGVGLYLQHLGRPSAELRLATPTSLRHSSEIGGNWFAPIRVEIPTAAGHPGPQFGVVAERLARARSEPALRLTSTLAATLGRLPARLLIPALHAQADTVDFAATTLPGSRRQPHLCGAAVEHSYPFGPRLGCPINISAFGNEDRLDVGIALDPATIVEPDALLDCLTSAFKGFAPALETPGRRSTGGVSSGRVFQPQTPSA